MLKRKNGHFEYTSQRGDVFFIRTEGFLFWKRWIIADQGGIYEFLSLEAVLQALADYEAEIEPYVYLKDQGLIFELQERVLEAQQEADYWHQRYLIASEQRDGLSEYIIGMEE